MIGHTENKQGTGLQDTRGFSQDSVKVGNML